MDEKHAQIPFSFEIDFCFQSAVKKWKRDDQYHLYVIFHEKAEKLYVGLSLYRHQVKIAGIV